MGLRLYSFPPFAAIFPCFAALKGSLKLSIQNVRSRLVEFWRIRSLSAQSYLFHVGHTNADKRRISLSNARWGQNKTPSKCLHNG